MPSSHLYRAFIYLVVLLNAEFILYYISNSPLMKHLTLPCRWSRCTPTLQIHLLENHSPVCILCAYHSYSVVCIIRTFPPLFFFVYFTSFWLWLIMFRFNLLTGKKCFCETFKFKIWIIFFFDNCSTKVFFFHFFFFLGGGGII